MISPKNHDGVIGVFTFLQGIQHDPNTGIRERTRRQIPLNRMLPFTMLLDDAKGLAPTGLSTPPWRNVVQIVFKCDRQLNFAQGMHVEVFLWRIPTEVRTKDAARQKEGLFVIAPQERSRALGRFPVGSFFFGNSQRHPIRPIFIVVESELVAHPVQ